MRFSASEAIRNRFRTMAMKSTKLCGFGAPCPRGRPRIDTRGGRDLGGVGGNMGLRGVTLEGTRSPVPHSARSIDQSFVAGEIEHRCIEHLDLLFGFHRFLE